ncbi:hypothetical protein D3C72_2423130 [compost metagenome]
MLGVNGVPDIELGDDEHETAQHADEERSPVGHSVLKGYLANNQILSVRFHTIIL